eukprot:gene17425-19169_t
MIEDIERQSLIENDANRVNSADQRPASRQHVGTEISFYNVSYTVPVKVKRKKVQKTLLKNVSGIMKPGLHAILGPTGSGKTTLLDILAARKNKKFLSGYVLINGELQPSNFKIFSGYVVQDDVVMGTLTVKENLMFSAALRLPSHLDKHDKEARVDMVINDLGLTKVANFKVGNEFIRGVSGGEKRRTSIGMELITSPDILFLDEPTTGLDASTAFSVMQLLNKQARRGRTVIFSIHQPRYNIFKLFDTLTLLSNGETVYHGDCQSILPHFERIGYVCEEYNNPPDFLLDVINQEEKSLQVTKAVDNCQAQENEEERNGFIEYSYGSALVEKYKETVFYKKTIDELSAQIDALNENQKYHDDRNKDNAIVYPSSVITQFARVSGRSFLNIIRNPKTGIAQIGINILFAIIIGIIYFQIDLGESGLQNRIGVFFFLTMNMIFGNMNAIQIFIDERVIFIHECASGYYRVSSYFLAKVFCDILPMRIIPILIFSSITYWMIGLRSDVERFLIFTLNLVLTSLSSSAVCFAVSSSVKIFALASLLTVLPYIFMMIFSGMLINLKQMAAWLSWLKYFSIFRYSLSSLDINELAGLKFHCPKGVPCPSGDDYLRSQGIHVGDLWYNMIALGVITLALLLIAYIQLRRIKKDK